MLSASNFTLKLLLDKRRLNARIKGNIMEQVFKGERDGAYEVAIKLFNATGCTEEEANVLMNEISLLRSCRHSNIVQVSGHGFGYLAHSAKWHTFQCSARCLVLKPWYFLESFSTKTGPHVTGPHVVYQEGFGQGSYSFVWGYSCVVEL